MRHQQSVPHNESIASRAGRRPSLISLCATGLLVLGCLIVGFGVLCILFAPLVIGTGVALALCGVLSYAMIILVQAVGFLLRKLVQRSRSTFLYRELSPVVLALMRQMAQQLVTLLIEWLNQAAASNSGHTRRSQRKPPPRFQLLAP